MSAIPDRQFTRYLASLALCLAVGIAAAVAFVAVVDPYGLYGWVHGSFNAIKPGLSRYQSEIKLQRAIRRQPQFIILGNSRAEIGFDPASPAFGAAAGHGFNLAIPGTGIDTSVRQLQGLAAAGIAPATVIIGVDFLDFLDTKASRRGASVLAPVVAPAAASARWWQFDALFSMESLKDAVRTLRIQHDDEAATLSPYGFNPLNEYKAYVRDDGYHKIFQQRTMENAANFRRKSRTALSAGDLRSLHTLLTAASAGSAEVKLVIYPYHAQILAMFEDAGLWPLFEEWKRQLVREVAVVKQARPAANITLFDFSGFGTMPCEHIPLESEKGKVGTQWYWEAGHFKKKLGDMVLARVMQPADARMVPGFGVVLNASTLAGDAQRIASERSACSGAQPALFAFSKKLFAH